MAWHGCEQGQLIGASGGVAAASEASVPCACRTGVQACVVELLGSGVAAWIGHCDSGSSASV
eukprot:CAMPEP_0204519774 /NCGR_PEP_ID=MMETSP0661-20131031/4909_1 /ASSEMBLY_ACC=CAM_ASM_000606 /TAXON_ID=109239 /ORGANISM="Alexandrium margalefi, Strain AMGDE01CS-322" /LENGTH=61 /DNA_ID=CAMNT_0051525289 /DNA_START=92 /DNA_END=274 /DNA_ORIENTATION=-